MEENDEFADIPFARKRESPQKLNLFHEGRSDRQSPSNVNQEVNCEVNREVNQETKMTETRSDTGVHAPMTSFQHSFAHVLADPAYQKRHKELVSLLQDQHRSLESVTPNQLPSTSTASPISSSTANLVMPVVTKAAGTNAIIVNKVQKGNAVLDHIRNVPWEFGETICDYQVGQTSAVLYLSLKYHRLHPDYIVMRLNRMKDRFHVRILLVRVDIDDHQSTLREIHRLSFQHNITVILAWSVQEAARYLETYKAYEHKPPDMIRAPKDTSGGDMYMNRLTEALTQIKSVNKTDVLTLATNVGSFKDIVHADQDTFRLLSGFGESKTKRLYEAFRQPFKLDRAQQKNARK